MVPVQLTDEWGSAYFQVAVVLFVLALGLPSLLVQAGVPPELRRALGREVLGRRFVLPLLVVYAFATALYLWVLTPAPPAPAAAAAPDPAGVASSPAAPGSPAVDSTRADTARPAVPPPVPESVYPALPDPPGRFVVPAPARPERVRVRESAPRRTPPAREPATAPDRTTSPDSLFPPVPAALPGPAAAGDTAALPARGLAPAAEEGIAPQQALGGAGARTGAGAGRERRWRDFWAAACMTALLFGTVWAWWRLARFGDRDYLVTRLKEQGHRVLDRGGDLDAAVIGSIAYLGQRAQAGHEKLQALDALVSLAEREAASGTYDGTRLWPVIVAMEQVMSGEWSEPDHLEASYRLQTVLKLTQGRENPSDAGYVEAAASRQVLASARNGKMLSQPLAASFIRMLSNSRLLYEVGVVCVESGYFLAALWVLNRMYSASGGDLAANDSHYAYVLGLLAHLSASGASAHQYVLQTFQSYGLEPGPARVQLVEEARKFHVRTVRFATADCLLALRRRL